MDRCPVCNESVDGGQICFNCNFDKRILKTIQQFEEQNSDAEPVKRGRGVVAKSVVRRHREKWLETQREFEFDFSYTKLRKYKGPSFNVVVPYGVEVIEGAFFENHTIKKVVLPETVERIGKNAFYSCKNLEFVYIPKSTTHIEEDAFSGCVSLSVIIPNGISTIDESAFNQVKSICVSDENTLFMVHQGMLIDLRTSTLLAAAFEKDGMDITIPEGVKKIGAHAFAIKNNFPRSIILPRSLTHINEWALVNIAKTPVTIPNSVTKIESSAFSMPFDVMLENGNPNYIQRDNVIIEVETKTLLSVCSKRCTNIQIPQGVSAIAEGAFANCQKLVEVAIPRTVKSIGFGAFSRCFSLKSIVIPYSVAQMGSDVFNQCCSLNTIFCECETMPSGWEKTWLRGCKARIDGCKESIDVPYESSKVFSIDKMDGHKFEYFCAQLLKKNGFSEINVTKGSGDQGVDILAQKDGIKYAIQCKNYSSHLGNTPVQEVNAGKIFYNCHVGVVMTNSTFTQGARALAQATGILLWDRSVLFKMIENAN